MILPFDSRPPIDSLVSKMVVETKGFDDPVGMDDRGIYGAAANPAVA